MPLKNAAVDIWHCDAGGLYSGFTEVVPGPPPGDGGPPGKGPRDGQPPRGPGGPKGPPPGGGSKPTDDLTFLRGIQMTDENGIAEFETIYPGWYMGRTIHIHFKVRVDEGSGNFRDGHTCHTGQLFIADRITDEVAQLDHYRDNDTLYTRQDEDHIYLDQHGADFLLNLNYKNGQSLAQGLEGTVTVALQPSKKSAQ